MSDERFMVAGADTSDGLGAMDIAPVLGSGDILYGKMPFFPDKRLSGLVGSDRRETSCAGAEGRGKGRGGRGSRHGEQWKENRQPVSVRVHSPGSHSGNGEHCRGGYGPGSRRSRSSVLDVGLRPDRDDDSLWGNHAGDPLPL